MGRRRRPLIAAASASIAGFALSCVACRRPPDPAPSQASAAVSALAVPVAPLVPVEPETPPPRGTHIALLYTSNVFGEYEQCGCPSHPMGGLARKATVVDEAREQADAAIVVDAGDLFLPARPNLHAPAANMLPPDPSEVERRARLVAAGVSRVGLHAYVPGERDLSLGLPLLKRILKQARIPAVCANLVDQRGQSVFDPDRIVDAAGVKVGIFGLLKAQPDEAELWKSWRLSTTDPAETARAEITSLRQRGADIVVALLHMGPIAEARELLKAVPGIDWAVLGHSDQYFLTPETVGDARMVEALNMGKHVGRLDLHVVDGKMKFSDRGPRAHLIAVREENHRQITDLRKRALEDKSGKLADFYAKRAADLEKSIATQTEFLKSQPLRVTGSWYENSIRPLETSIVDHPGLAMLVSEYNDENRRRAAAGKPVGIAYRPATAPRPATGAPSPAAPPAADTAAATQVPVKAAEPEPLTYAGAVACGSCHAPAMKQWQETKHAHALATLKKRNRDGDPTCVGCHVTGFLRPGGTRDIDVAANLLKDVGCESCHGPGLAHVTSDDKKGTTTRKVPESICLGCHTPDQTNGEFDYQAFVKAITGPGHGGS